MDGNAVTWPDLLIALVPESHPPGRGERMQRVFILPVLLLLLTVNAVCAESLLQLNGSSQVS